MICISRSSKVVLRLENSAIVAGPARRCEAENTAPALLHRGEWWGCDFPVACFWSWRLKFFFHNGCFEIYSLEMTNIALEHGHRNREIVSVPIQNCNFPSLCQFTRGYYCLDMLYENWDDLGSLCWHDLSQVSRGVTLEGETTPSQLVVDLFERQRVAGKEGQAVRFVVRPLALDANHGVPWIFTYTFTPNIWPTCR